MRVFYIDDEKGNTILFSRAMPSNFKTTTFTNPLEAEIALLKERPDVIVSDEDMPQMRGIELLKKAKEVLPESLRIIVTGKVDINALESEASSGAVHFFVGKPYDPNFIVSRIQTHFGEKGVGSLAPSTDKPAVQESYTSKTFETARAIYLERQQLVSQVERMDKELDDKAADLFMQLGSAISYKNFRSLLSMAHEDSHSYEEFQEIYWRFNSIKKGSQ